MNILTKSTSVIFETVISNIYVHTLHFVKNKIAQIICRIFNLARQPFTGNLNKLQELSCPYGKTKIMEKYHLCIFSIPIWLTTLCARAVYCMC